MKKVTLLFIIVFICLIIVAEPYRPYPIIFVHGYNTNNTLSSNFGLTMEKSVENGIIKYPIKASPYFSSRSGELSSDISLIHLEP